jgi:apolipoprotein N-acyltransferase
MIIDPTGKRQLATNLYTKTNFIADIGLLSGKTFYVEYGDILARISLAASIMLLITAFMQRNKAKRK